MAEVTSRMVVHAPAEKVWAVAGDPARISDWHPAVAESATDGPGAGATRRCTLADGAKLVERIESHDDSARRYTYTITEGALPVRDYRATLRVEDADGGRAALVVWTGSFQPEGVEPAEAEALVQRIYDSGLAALKDKIEG